jgi:hypothetical protein
MPRPEDLEGGRSVRKELARRPIDTSLAQIHISHGVVRIGGQVRAMRGHNMDLRAEMELIAKVLKQKPGIRDVILECIYRE